MADPGAFGVYQWAQKVPLVDQWPQVRGQRQFRLAYLAYWVEKSESDPWTFHQLQELLGSMIDAGERVPAALQSWANEVASGRRREPRRTGPKGDRTKDCWIAAGVHILSKCGMSQREVKRQMGRVLSKSEEAIESARRRGLAVCQLAPK